MQQNGLERERSPAGESLGVRVTCEESDRVLGVLVSGSVGHMGIVAETLEYLAAQTRETSDTTAGTDARHLSTEHSTLVVVHAASKIHFHQLLEELWTG